MRSRAINIFPPVEPHQTSGFQVGLEAEAYPGQRLLSADYRSGTLWALSPKPGSAAIAAGANPSRDAFEPPRVLIEAGPNVSSFGEGLDGELYLIAHQDGVIYRLVAK